MTHGKGKEEEGRISANSRRKKHMTGHRGRDSRSIGLFLQNESGVGEEKVT